MIDDPNKLYLPLPLLNCLSKLRDVFICMLERLNAGGRTLLNVASVCLSFTIFVIVGRALHYFSFYYANCYSRC